MYLFVAFIIRTSKKKTPCANAMLFYRPFVAFNVCITIMYYYFASISIGIIQLAMYFM